MGGAKKKTKTVSPEIERKRRLMGQNNTKTRNTEDGLTSVIPSAPTKQPFQLKKQEQQPCNEEEMRPETVRKSEKLAQFAPICSEIEPFLYVSGMAVALNKAVLKEHGITHILNCAKEVVDDAFEESFHYLSLALRDGASENLGVFFYEFFDQIEAVRHAKQKILIHCQQGVSRSCTVAIAYLMWSHHLSYEAAFARVKARRGVCSPNSGFICQLLELQATLTKTSAKPQVKVYRIAPYSAAEPRLALKPCWTEGTRAWASPDVAMLHSKACLLIQTTGALYTWRGTQNAVADTMIHDYVGRLRRYEDLNHVSLRGQIPGQETEDFKALFTSNEPFKVCDVEPYPYAMEWTYGEALVDHSVSAEVEPADAKVELWGVDLSSCELEEIGNYDSDDLVPDMIYYLKTLSSIHYLWLGHAHQGLNPAQLVAHVQRVVPDWKADLVLEIEHEGQESDAFWDAFEQGY